MKCRKTGRCWRLSLCLIASAASFTFSPAAARAIDVSQSFWGFDGQAKVHSFNLLSVLVTNPQGRPFERTLELRESVTSGSTVGAALVEDVYIAPNSSRWVQFYPYVNDNWE